MNHSAGQTYFSGKLEASYITHALFKFDDFDKTRKNAKFNPSIRTHIHPHIHISREKGRRTQIYLTILNLMFLNPIPNATDSRWKYNHFLIGVISRKYAPIFMIFFKCPTMFNWLAFFAFLAAAGTTAIVRCCRKKANVVRLPKTNSESRGFLKIIIFVELGHLHFRFVILNIIFLIYLHLSCFVVEWIKSCQKISQLTRYKYNKKLYSLLCVVISLLYDYPAI